ncbi:transcriptional adapter ADA2b isoform X2 [Primulina tabacum]|uniref:transcriptional adapter ADA2b isoform X2 n=1 Tax=Primulina tabacum TaxID=48773 RepID=UPI003F5A9DCF
MTLELGFVLCDIYTIYVIRRAYDVQYIKLVYILLLILECSGPGTSEGKRALYHCNYCNKDITGRIRIKCGVCSDFDLCIECFSVGAEVHPHKSGHRYRVMDILSFPLICPEWNADEEMLLLEGIEMYGMCNWAEVAEHVGTKTKEACIEHYRNAYLNSPHFPIPDMTHVVGKNRNELLAMAKGHLDDKRGELQLKEESLFSPSRVKVEDSYKSGPSGRLPSTSMAENFTGAKVKASNMAHIKDQGDLLKMEGRSFGGNKPKSAKIEAPSLPDSGGYNAKRQEFDPEYDNDAEQMLADMEFKETDTEEERELKLRVLRIYSKRLDERKRRKDFILDRNILHPSPFRKELSQEEKDLCWRYDVFMRFHSKEEHEELLKTVVSEYRILKRIQELKEARAAGCRSSAEADRYLEQKRREAEDDASLRESYQAGPSSQESLSIPVSSDSFGAYSNTPSAVQANSTQTDMDIVSFSAANCLSESEKQLCHEIRLAPPDFLKLQAEMTIQFMIGNLSNKSDAYSFFQVDRTKIDRVYDLLLKKGLVLQ